MSNVKAGTLQVGPLGTSDRQFSVNRKGHTSFQIGNIKDDDSVTLVEQSQDMELFSSLSTRGMLNRTEYTGIFDPTDNTSAFLTGSRTGLTPETRNSSAFQQIDQFLLTYLFDTPPLLRLLEPAEIDPVSPVQNPSFFPNNFTIATALPPQQQLNHDTKYTPFFRENRLEHVMKIQELLVDTTSGTVQRTKGLNLRLPATPYPNLTLVKSTSASEGVLYKMKHKNGVNPGSTTSPLKLFSYNGTTYTPLPNNPDVFTMSYNGANLTELRLRSQCPSTIFYQIESAGSAYGMITVTTDAFHLIDEHIFSITEPPTHSPSGIFTNSVISVAETVTTDLSGQYASAFGRPGEVVAVDTLNKTVTVQSSDVSSMYVTRLRQFDSLIIGIPLHGQNPPQSDTDFTNAISHGMVLNTGMIQNQVFQGSTSTFVERSDGRPNVTNFRFRNATGSETQVEKTQDSTGRFEYTADLFGAIVAQLPYDVRLYAVGAHLCTTTDGTSSESVNRQLKYLVLNDLSTAQPGAPGAPTNYDASGSTHVITVAGSDVQEVTLVGDYTDPTITDINSGTALLPISQQQIVITSSASKRFGAFESLGHSTSQNFHTVTFFRPFPEAAVTNSIASDFNIKAFKMVLGTVLDASGVNLAHSHFAFSSAGGATIRPATDYTSTVQVKNTISSDFSSASNVTTFSIGLPHRPAQAPRIGRTTDDASGLFVENEDSYKIVPLSGSGSSVTVSTTATSSRIRTLAGVTAGFGTHACTYINLKSTAVGAVVKTQSKYAHYMRDEEVGILSNKAGTVTAGGVTKTVPAGTLITAGTVNANSDLALLAAYVRNGDSIQQDVTLSTTTDLYSAMPKVTLTGFNGAAAAATTPGTTAGTGADAEDQTGLRISITEKDMYAANEGLVNQSWFPDVRVPTGTAGQHLINDVDVLKSFQGLYKYGEFQLELGSSTAGANFHNKFPASSTEYLMKTWLTNIAGSSTEALTHALAVDDFDEAPTIDAGQVFDTAPDVTFASGVPSIDTSQTDQYSVFVTGSKLAAHYLRSDGQVATVQLFDDDTDQTASPAHTFNVVAFDFQNESSSPGVNLVADATSFNSFSPTPTVGSKFLVRYKDHSTTIGWPPLTALNNYMAPAFITSISTSAGQVTIQLSETSGGVSITAGASVQLRLTLADHLFETNALGGVAPEPFHYSITPHNNGSAFASHPNRIQLNTTLTLTDPHLVSEDLKVRSQVFNVLTQSAIVDGGFKEAQTLPQVATETVGPASNTLRVDGRSVELQKYYQQYNPANITGSYATAGSVNTWRANFQRTYEFSVPLTEAIVSTQQNSLVVANNTANNKYILPGGKLYRVGSAIQGTDGHTIATVEADPNTNNTTITLAGGAQATTAGIGTSVTFRYFFTAIPGVRVTAGGDATAGGMPVLATTAGAYSSTTAGTSNSMGVLFDEQLPLTTQSGQELQYYAAKFLNATTTNLTSYPGAYKDYGGYIVRNGATGGGTSQVPTRTMPNYSSLRSDTGLRWYTTRFGPGLVPNGYSFSKFILWIGGFNPSLSGASSQTTADVPNVTTNGLGVFDAAAFSTYDTVTTFGNFVAMPNNSTDNNKQFSTVNGQNFVVQIMVVDPSNTANGGTYTTEVYNAGMTMPDDGIGTAGGQSKSLVGCLSGTAGEKSSLVARNCTVQYGASAPNHNALVFVRIGMQMTGDTHFDGINFQDVRVEALAQDAGGAALPGCVSAFREFAA